MAKGAGWLLLALGLYAPPGLWLYTHLSVAAEEQQRLAAGFVMPDRCQPEPGESAAYQAGILFVAGCLFAFSFVWRTRTSRAESPIGRRLLWFAELGLAVALVAFCVWAVRGPAQAPDEKYYHVCLNVFFEYPLATLPLFLLSLSVAGSKLWSWPAARLATHGAALCIIATIFLASLFNERGLYTYHGHFAAMFFPVVQVYQGRALLIDSLNQYGLYPHFLGPLFAVLGLDVLRFTVVMGLLTAAGFAALWLFLSEATRRRGVALAGFLALVCESWFFYQSCGNDQPKPFLELFFQYFPIRFLFPSLSVWLAWRAWRQPGRLRYWALMFFLGAGVLWNAEAGVVALAAWLAGLLYEESFAADWRRALRGAAGHLAAAALAVGTACLVYAAIIHMRYGAFPDYRALFVHQRIFYISGFNMLPLPWPGTWMVVALVYLAGLTYAAGARAAQEPSVRATMMVFLAVLGFGLLTYYQGRSHRVVLTLAWWPCFLLLTLFLDECLERGPLRRRRPLLATVSGLGVWILAGAAAGLFVHASFLRESIGKHLRQIADRTAVPPWRDEVEFLRDHVAADEELLIVSHRDAYLHLASERRTLAPCSYIQMLRLEDVEALLRLVDEKRARVYIDRESYEDRSWAGARPLVALLRRGSRIVAQTGSGYLLEYCPGLLRRQSRRTEPVRPSCKPAVRCGRTP
jgi:hypothetical protein